MSNDPKQSQPQQPKTIPVRAIHFNVKRMLPNNTMSDVVLSDASQANKPRFVIEYMPALQMHRVAYFAPSASTPTKVLMYPSDWCSWEPQPQ